MTESLEFDYIIVGAGSAGCVLADRLTADGRHSVLLAEAGGSDRRWAIRVPIGYGFTFSDPRVNWRYRTEADPGLGGRFGYWPRGKVIGGSSSINAMCYVRGLPRDFDDWGASGADGWNWASVEPSYCALETHRGFDRAGRRTVRGDGPLTVSDLSDRMHPFSGRFLEAARDVGWPVLAAVEGEGLSYFHSTVRDGLRVSAADAFLRPARKRRNLRVLSNALVTRIDVSDGGARRLRLRVGGVDRVATARAEIILSAGAINTPQLLQLSGIGAAEDLRAHGLPVVRDLGQVGKGLQDHLAVSHQYEATEPTLNNRLGGRFGQALAVIRYALTRNGPLSVPINQVGGFVRSDGAGAVPDVQVFCNPATYSIPPSGVPRIDPTAGFLLSAQPCRPTSRGEVRLASADPEDRPLIQANSLATEADRAAAVSACKVIRTLAASPTLRRVTRATRTPDVAAMSDDEMLDDFRQRASTVFHPCCTCRMGRDPSGSVVDGRLRVHGLDRVRVVDASAFPSITSGNINAPTLMLASRAADMILEDARR